MFAASVKARRRLLDGFPQGIRQVRDLFRLGFRERILPLPAQEIVSNLCELAMFLGNGFALLYRGLHQLWMLCFLVAKQNDDLRFAAAVETNRSDVAVTRADNAS